MKHTLFNYFLLLLIICSCNKKQSTNLNIHKEKKEEASHAQKSQSIENIDSLLSNFVFNDKKDILIGGNEQIDVNPIYIGDRIIDSTYYNFFNQVYQKKGYLAFLFSKTNNLHSYQYFKLSQEKLGLTVIQLGRYDYSVIDLVIYDTKLKQFVDIINLADDWGDAGYIFTKKSRIIDINQDGNLDIISWEREFSPSGEIEKDWVNTKGILTDSTYIYKNEEGIFKKIIAHTTVDSVKVSEIDDQFSLIERLSSDTLFFEKNLDDFKIDFSDYKN